MHSIYGFKWNVNSFNSPSLYVLMSSQKEYEIWALVLSGRTHHATSPFFTMIQYNFILIAHQTLQKDVLLLAIQNVLIFQFSTSGFPCDIFIIEINSTALPTVGRFCSTHICAAVNFVCVFVCRMRKHMHVCTECVLCVYCTSHRNWLHFRTFQDNGNEKKYACLFICARFPFIILKLSKRCAWC